MKEFFVYYKEWQKIKYNEDFQYDKDTYMDVKDLAYIYN